MGAHSSERQQNTKDDKWTSQKRNDSRTTGTDKEISDQLLFLDDLMQTKLKMCRRRGTGKINERCL